MRQLWLRRARKLHVEMSNLIDLTKTHVIAIYKNETRAVACLASGRPAIVGLSAIYEYQVTCARCLEILRAHRKRTT